MGQRQHEADQDEYHDSKYGLEPNFDNSERTAIANKIKKNTLNNKFLNKRTVGGSCSFREDYANSINSNNLPIWKNNKGLLPKLKSDKLSKMRTNDTEASSPSPQTIKNYAQKTQKIRENKSSIIKTASNITNLKASKNFTNDDEEYFKEEVSIIWFPFLAQNKIYFGLDHKYSNSSKPRLQWEQESGSK
jgi:hypothetical protein